MRIPSLKKVSLLVLATGAVAALLVIPAWASDDDPGDSTQGSNAVATLDPSDCTASGDASAAIAVPAGKVEKLDDADSGDLSDGATLEALPVKGDGCDLADSEGVICATPTQPTVEGSKAIEVKPEPDASK